MKGNQKGKNSMSINFEPLYIWQADENTIKSVAFAETNLQEALQQLGNIENLLVFAKELQAYSDERPKEVYVQACFGGIFEVAAECDKRALCFETEFPIENEYLYVVVKAAKHAGLTVYDPNNGCVFLPSGRVLPPNANNWWNEVVAEQEKEAQLLAANPALPKSRDQFEEWVAPVYKETLQAHGFIEETKKVSRSGDEPDIDYIRVYSRETAIGTQSISVMYFGVYPYFDCSSLVEFSMTYPPSIAHITRELEQRHNTRLFVTKIFNFRLNHIYLKTAMQNQPIHIMEFDRHKNCDLIVKGIIPRFNQMLDLSGLDKFINNRQDVIFKNCDEVDKDVDIMHLVIAKLVKNPNFEKLVAAFKKSSLWKFKARSNQESVYLKIIDDIRNWPES